MDMRGAKRLDCADQVLDLVAKKGDVAVQRAILQGGSAANEVTHGAEVERVRAMKTVMANAASIAHAETFQAVLFTNRVTIRKATMTARASWLL